MRKYTPNHHSILNDFFHPRITHRIPHRTNALTTLTGQGYCNTPEYSNLDQSRRAQEKVKISFQNYDPPVTPTTRRWSYGS